MAVYTPEFSFTLTDVWVKVLDANPSRRFLHMAPVTTVFDAYWTTRPVLAGTNTPGGTPMLSGEDFSYEPGVCPTDAIYMRSAGGEVVTVREGA